MMKKLLTIVLACLLITFYACQKDTGILPSDNSSGENFIGKWNIDTVIVYEVAGTKLTELTRNVNYGYYDLKADETGILNIAGVDFAVTWFYAKDQQKINISEKDWVNQNYNITSLTKDKYMLYGTKFVSTSQLARRIYLTKK